MVLRSWFKLVYRTLIVEKNHHHHTKTIKISCLRVGWTQPDKRRELEHSALSGMPPSNASPLASPWKRRQKVYKRQGGWRTATKQSLVNTAWPRDIEIHRGCGSRYRAFFFFFYRGLYHMGSFLELKGEADTLPPIPSPEALCNW